MWHPVYKRVHVKAMRVHYFFRRVGHFLFQVWELWMKKEFRLAPDLADQRLFLDSKREVFWFYSTNSYRSLNIWGETLTTKQKLQFTNLQWPPMIGLRNETVYQMGRWILLYGWAVFLWFGKMKKKSVKVSDVQLSQRARDFPG